MTELSADDRITCGKTAAALGIFDGVHQGHTAVVGKAAEIAEKNGYLPAVCSFKTATITTKGGDYRPICTDADKLYLLEQVGIKYAYLPDFSELRSMTAEEFIRVIIRDKMNAAAIVCGKDFHLGKNAVCGTQELAVICNEFGLTLTVVDDVSDGGVRISSARIRNLLQSGDIKTADRLLGYDYFVRSHVIAGKQLARKMNYPTANQLMDSSVMLPKFGVYASYAEIDGRIYRGVTNIGVKPTVAESDTVLAETHFPTFCGDLYGKLLTVRLVDFIRPEMRFDSITELFERIGRDSERVSAMTYPVEAY